MGIARGTASVELNDRELARIGIEEQVFIAYGYQPVMSVQDVSRRPVLPVMEKAVYFRFRIVIRRSLQSDDIAETAIM